MSPVRKAKRVPRRKPRPIPDDVVLRVHVSGHQMHYLRQMVTLGLRGKNENEVAYTLIVDGILQAAKHRLVVLVDKGDIPLMMFGERL